MATVGMHYKQSHVVLCVAESKQAAKKFSIKSQYYKTPRNHFALVFSMNYTLYDM